LKVVFVASAMSAIFSYILDFYMYDYKTFNSDFVLLQLISFIVSAIFLAGVFSHLVTKRLLRLGLLDQFLIAKNQNV
jgi:ABC-type thiamin/hydroxymethylpyrimidine transport system permease subunit